MANFYNQFRARLLKHKEYYEKELYLVLSNPYTYNQNEEIRLKGQLDMLNIIIDDLDSMPDIIYCIEVNNNNVKKDITHKNDFCDGKCDKCHYALDKRSEYLHESESIFQAASKYSDFVMECREHNGIKKE